MNKFTKTLNKRPLKLDKECEEEGSSTFPNKKSSFSIQIHAIQKKFYQVNKRLKQAQDNFKKIRKSLPPSHKQIENNKQKKLLDEKITQLKNEENLDGNIICSTDSFLSLILTQPCSCRNNDISQKKCKISASGLSVKMMIKYKKCKETLSFQNEPPDMNYAKAFTAATLCDGKSIYYKYQKSLDESIKNIALENIKKALYISIEDAKKKEKNCLTENHKANSKQIEHAVLIRILEKVVPILEETDMLLDIVVDEDLDSNKTLREVKCVNKIFPDFKHLTQSNEKDLPLTTELVKHIQMHGLTKHLCNDHLECWPESLITNARTSQNEAFNRQKLSFVSKLIDYWKTYSVRHALAVIHNNSGLLSMLQSIRAQKGLSSFSENVILNIEHISESKTFYPFFADLIYKYHDISNKCIDCQSFSKQFSNGYCKICNLWNCLRFTQKIPETKLRAADNKLLISNQASDLNQILKQVFGFLNFCEGQYEAICLFLENKDTLVVLRTGGGKTLCFAMAALTSIHLIIVFTPLKALIDDHVNNFVYMGIPAAGLYISTGQSFKY
ncbi:DNA helicase RecQ [Rhizophagus clarus]|uniref:DNA 3'-5' helicase n=1 Tax=Rhizophagus clarus TaxID=94130 RepID=A0A8H3KWX4_9GLOM|nr:DNA helicase RecQ [Rhizophagus clarus]